MSKLFGSTRVGDIEFYNRFDEFAAHLEHLSDIDLLATFDINEEFLQSRDFVTANTAAKSLELISNELERRRLNNIT